MIAISLLYLGLLATIFYISNQEFKAGGIHTFLGLFFYLLAIPASWGISYLIMMFSDGEPWFGFTETLFIIHIVLGSIGIICIVLFAIIDTVSKGITGKAAKEYLK